MGNMELREQNENKTTSVQNEQFETMKNLMARKVNY